MAERQTERSQSIPRLWPFKRLFYGWGIVGTSMVVLIAQVPMYGPVLSVFVKPIGDDLGWSRGEISLAFTLGTLVGLSVSSIVGAKIDRYGARVAVVSAGVVVTASLAGLALMQEVWQFWLLFGLGRTAALSGINLGTTVAVANWFVRKRGRAVSLLVIGLRGGQALFPLFITPIIILLSWRHAYATLAVIAFVFIVVPGWVFLRRRPEDLGLRPDGLPPEPEPPKESANEAPTDSRARAAAASEQSWTAREARRTPAFWLLAVATAVVVFVLTAVNLHAVASFQDRGIGGSVAGLFVFVFAGTAAVSAYSWGMLMDRIDVRWGSLLATFFLAAAMVLLIVADNVAMALAFAVVFGLAAGGWTIAQTLLFANYFGRGHLGAVRGASQVVSAPIGAAGPLMAGYLQTYTGSYESSFQLSLAFLAVVVLALILAKPPSRR